MNRSTAAITAVAAAATATGQSWDFELSNPVLTPASPSTRITLIVDPGPGDYALAAARLDVHASEAGWTGDQRSLIPWPVTDPPSPGTVMGSSVEDVTLIQLPPDLGFSPIPGRFAAWTSTFLVTDFSTPRAVDFLTDTFRMDVYEEPFVAPWPRRTVEVREGEGSITVIPAPGGGVLLSLGAGAMLRRRRRGAGNRRPLAVGDATW